ncbi:MAG: GNAT family N-acetyltransferase [Erysipelotrichaceae bacterium]|nr:GNAT family N-acetyltransferase [Erysipelotrichaceae bacterium]
MKYIEELGIENKEEIKSLFYSVFSIEPWNDDWSDERQLDLYITDLIGQNNSVSFGLYVDDELIGLSLGRFKHWYSGLEYFIDELCIKTDRQGEGLGSFFLREIEKDLKTKGYKAILLQTEKEMPAFDFYIANGYLPMKGTVNFVKDI